MKRDAVMAMVLDEISSAEKKWPGWPLDPVHAAAIVVEESGEPEPGEPGEPENIPEES